MILYSNGCSFGLPVGSPARSYNTVLSAAIGADLISEHRPGSCNRRIVRTSLRDLISLRQRTADNILVLIGLSFFFRTELWQTHLPPTSTDGHFHPVSIDRLHVIQTKTHYSGDIEDAFRNTDVRVRDWYKQYLIWQNKEALLVDLLGDICMFIAFCQQHDMSCLIWNNADIWPGQPQVNQDDVFMKDFKNHAMQHGNLIDPWQFAFLPWALQQGFKPVDYDLYGDYGHPSPEAHEKLADFLLSELQERRLL